MAAVGIGSQVGAPAPVGSLAPRIDSPGTRSTANVGGSGHRIDGEPQRREDGGKERSCSDDECRLHPLPPRRGGGRLGPGRPAVPTRRRRAPGSCHRPCGAVPHRSPMIAAAMSAWTSSSWCRDSSSPGCCCASGRAAEDRLPLLLRPPGSPDPAGGPRGDRGIPGGHGPAVRRPSLGVGCQRQPVEHGTLPGQLPLRIGLREQLIIHQGVAPDQSVVAGRGGAVLPGVPGGSRPGRPGRPSVDIPGRAGHRPDGGGGGLVRGLGAPHPIGDYKAYYSPLCRAWELALGGLVALATPWLRRVPNGVATLATWCGLVAVVLSGMSSRRRRPTRMAAAHPVVATALVIAGGTARPVAGAETVLGRAPSGGSDGGPTRGTCGTGRFWSSTPSGITPAWWTCRWPPTSSWSVRRCSWPWPATHGSRTRCGTRPGCWPARPPAWRGGPAGGVVCGPDLCLLTRTRDGVGRGAGHRRGTPRQRAV